jgi:hypothetical protein
MTQEQLVFWDSGFMTAMAMTQVVISLYFLVQSVRAGRRERKRIEAQAEGLLR